MTTARDIITAEVTCVGEHDTIDVAAQRMRDLDVGALPIQGDDDRLYGMITDRDIVVLRCGRLGSHDYEGRPTGTGQCVLH